MTAAELREAITDTPLESDSVSKTSREWALLQCLASIVDALEQIREEMITRMPLLEERRESAYPYIDELPGSVDSTMD